MIGVLIWHVINNHCSYTIDENRDSTNNDRTSDYHNGKGNNYNTDDDDDDDDNDDNNNNNNSKTRVSMLRLLGHWCATMHGDVLELSDVYGLPQ